MREGIEFIRHQNGKAKGCPGCLRDDVSVLVLNGEVQHFLELVGTGGNPAGWIYIR